MPTPIPGLGPAPMGALVGLYSTPPGGFSGSFGSGGFSGQAFNVNAIMAFNQATYSGPPFSTQFAGSQGVAGVAGTSFATPAAASVGYGTGNQYQLIQPAPYYFGGQMVPNPPPVWNGNQLQGPYSPSGVSGPTYQPGQ